MDNRVFEVTLAGAGSDVFGILTHADVVPAVADEWVLDDGTRLDPFRLTRVGDYLYGRGTIDDKGSIAAALYAMKTVKESGVPLKRTIRLMIDTTEETGGDAIKYYRERTALPEFNIVLDSKYPAVVAEKGSGALKVLFPAQAADGTLPAIVAMSGAASANTVPQTAAARITGGDPAGVAAALEDARAAFIRAYEPRGGKFSIDVGRSADGIDVKVTGTSAHGSRPEEGVNPLPRLALFLQASGVALADNHYRKAVKYLNDLYGIGYLGESMGVGYADDFMGPLTMSPNLIRERDGQLEVITNVRMPRGSTPEALRDEDREAHQRLGRGQPRHRRDRPRAGQLDGARPEGRVAVDPAEHLWRHHRAGGKAGSHRRQHHRQAAAQRDQLRPGDARQEVHRAQRQRIQGSARSRPGHADVHRDAGAHRQSGPDAVGAARLPTADDLDRSDRAGAQYPVYAVVP